MCNKLLQTYACGHSKSVCTTPCGHAIQSSQTTISLIAPTGSVIRSKLAVSSIIPASRPPSRNFSRPQPSEKSSLRVIDHPSNLSPPAHIPAFRLVPPSKPSPTSPVSPVSSFASSVPPSQVPSLSPSPSPPSVAREHEQQPTFCNYYIPRHLVTSKYPCTECYGMGEWKELRARWMENYRLGHPLDRGDDVEIPSGVAGMLERAG